MTGSRRSPGVAAGTTGRGQGRNTATDGCRWRARYVGGQYRGREGLDHELMLLLICHACQVLLFCSLLRVYFVGSCVAARCDRRRPFACVCVAHRCPIVSLTRMKEGRAEAIDKWLRADQRVLIRMITPYISIAAPYLCKRVLFPAGGFLAGHMVRESPPYSGCTIVCL